MQISQMNLTSEKHFFIVTRSGIFEFEFQVCEHFLLEFGSVVMIGSIRKAPDSVDKLMECSFSSSRSSESLSSTRDDRKRRMDQSDPLIFSSVAPGKT